MSQTISQTLWLTLMLAGCRGGDAPTASGTDTSGGGPGCPAGQVGLLGCPCAAEEKCLEGLVCIESLGLCAEPPGTSGGAGTSGGPPPGLDLGDPNTTGNSATSGGGGSCALDSDCSWSEKCAGGSCYDACELTYSMRVSWFSPYQGCDQGGIRGYYDLLWKLAIDGTFVGASDWYQGGCPGDWPDTALITNPCAPNFSLDVYDEDVTSQTWLDGLCFDHPDIPGSQCGGAMPVSILLDGLYDGVTGNGSSVTVEFTPLAP